MKATLTFKLPEEKQDFDIAYKAMQTNIAIEEFDNALRQILKYEEKPEGVPNEIWETRIETYRTIREMFWKIINQTEDDL